MPIEKILVICYYGFNNTKGKVFMEENRETQNELEQVKENEVATANNKSTFLLVWKIVVAVLYVIITALLVWGLVDALIKLNTPVPDGKVNFNGLGFAIFLVIIVLVFGTIAYAINVITSIVGLVISRKKGADKGTKIYFIVFIFLPIITEILLFIIGRALGSG